jgi:hypothetical protein
MPNMRTARPQTPFRHRKRSHRGGFARVDPRDPLEFLTNLACPDLATFVVGDGPRERSRPIKKAGKEERRQKTV